MDPQLLTFLLRLTKEIEHLYYGEPRALFSEDEGLYIEKGTVIKSGDLITIRPHPRFCPTMTHRHNFIELMYVYQGSVTHTINGSTVVMEAGDIMLMNQHISHAVHPAGENDLAVNLIILPEFFETAINMVGRNNFLSDFIVDLLRNKKRKSQYLHFKLASNRQTNNLMENIVYSLVHKHRNETRINQTLIGLLFMYLLENTEALSHDAPNNYEEIMIRSIEMYIDEHYNTASLSEIAAEMHLPIAHLSRFVRKMTGHTFKELLQRRRFAVAEKMLLKTDLPVADIVTSVGYENHSYFFRCFRRLHGISPKEYRAAYANKTPTKGRGGNHSL